MGGAFNTVYDNNLDIISGQIHNQNSIDCFKKLINENILITYADEIAPIFINDISDFDTEVLEVFQQRNTVYLKANVSRSNGICASVQNYECLQLLLI